VLDHLDSWAVTIVVDADTGDVADEHLDDITTPELRLLR
jgi:hypothetical protein